MPSPAVAALEPAKPPSIRPMFYPELLAAFSAARSLIANLKNDDSQEAVPIHELASELRELVVEAVDD